MKTNRLRLRALLLIGMCGLLMGWITPARAEQSEICDTLVLGEPVSERAHGLRAENSATTAGVLGNPGRLLLPLTPPTWEGGHVEFTLKVDPEKPNYITIRLWGSEANVNRLILFCEGKQIGYRHLGDIDLLDCGDEAPALNGRFFYRTNPLPLAMTRGKTQLQFSIRCTGPIWGYGKTFEQYQKNMTAPTRTIHRLYTHTDGFFVPPANERQGAEVIDPPARTQPGPEVMEQVKQRVNREIDKLLISPRPLNQMQMNLLARAWHLNWTHACQKPAVVAQMITGTDALYATFLINPKIAQEDPATYNPDWYGLGPTGENVWLLAKPLAPSLGDALPDGKGGSVPRREAWTRMLQASRDWHLRHRRQYTNQALIIDMFTYLANKGVRVLEPAKALPESRMLQYLYESAGLQPWLGSDTDQGPERPLGNDYLQLTAKGLTKELGYVGYYGEILDLLAAIYNATRPEPNQPGDPQLKAQMIKAAHARAVFRYPAVDHDGYRAMRIETVVGWRDAHYPGDVTYVERTGWDATALDFSAATLEPTVTGYAQQMLEDNQLFATTAHQLKEPSMRVTRALMSLPGDYELIQQQSAQSARLPMSVGQPDFVFSDEEDGVIAIKRGKEILYCSLYWRAREGINSLARVHHITPQFDRIAVVREQVDFEPSGMQWQRPDFIDFGFANGGHRYPGDIHSAHTGEVLPIPKIPAGVKFKAGQESVYAGKGDFYTLRYGKYLIAMNTSTGKTFELKIPILATPGKELVSKRPVSSQDVLRIGPRSTVAVDLGIIP